MNLKDAGEITLLSILFVNKMVNCAFFIYYLINTKDMDILHLNRIVYIATTTAETALLITWVILYHKLYGLGSEGFYLYLATGAGLAAKLLINLVSQNNMMKYKEEVEEEEAETGEQFGFEEFLSKKA